ncbi:MAG: response regulator transcription factor [Pedobacter sp.]|nr:MAG: response regulator transcription factor [Pedobacter sp.]
MIKLILADDHPIVRNGIKGILEAEGDIEIVGEVSNGNEALAMLASKFDVDIVLTEINMSEMDGMMLLNRLQRDYPNIKVIILTMVDNDKFAFDAFEMGAKGYLSKSASIEELLFGIREVAAGKEVIYNELGIKMMKKASLNAQALEPDLQLNERETEVLALISEGHTNQQIADHIFASRRTVEGLRQTLVEKTGVKNTAQLVRFACKNGLI